MLCTTRRLLTETLLFSGCLAVLTGCPDTQGEFDAFGERYAEANPSGGGVVFTCMTPPMMAGDGDGNYLFALSAVLAPKFPILFDTDLTITAGGANGLQFTLLLQPLDRFDRMTPVGTPVTIGPGDLNADGSFDVDPPLISVTGMANSLSGSDLEVDLTTLNGHICNEDFMCGGVDGNVLQPPLGPVLAKSTWTMERLAAPGMFPEPPKINCAGELAEPPPMMGN